MTTQDSISNDFQLPAPPQRPSTNLDQNRIRVYVTIEFKNSNLKRRLAVSEKPDKNILDLKEKIEIEHNVLYKNQDIEIVEILLNDMFQITKDYSIGEIIQNDQAIKAIAKFRGNHMERVKQMSRFETMSLSSNMKASPSLVQPNIFEAMQKSAHNSTFIQFNAPENGENSLYQSFNNQEEQPLSQVSSNSVIISGYQGGTDAGKESHLGKRHLPKKLSMTIAKDQAQKKSVKNKKEAKHKIKEEDKKEQQFEKQERAVSSQITSVNNQEQQPATSQSLANTDSTAITAVATVPKEQEVQVKEEQPKKKRPPKVKKIESAKKDDQTDNKEEEKKNYTNSLKDKLKTVKKAVAPSSDKVETKKKETKPKEPKEQKKSPSKKPKKDAKAATDNNTEKPATDDKPKEPSKIIGSTLPKSKLAAALCKSNKETGGKEDGVANSKLALTHKRFNQPGKLLSSIQQQNIQCRRPTTVAAANTEAKKEEDDDKMHLEDDEDLSKIEVNIQKPNTLAGEAIENQYFESGISSPVIKNNLLPHSDKESTGKDSLNKVADCSSQGESDNNVKDSESGTQALKMLSCGQEAGMGGVESEINPSQITTVPNIITNESE